MNIDKNNYIEETELDINPSLTLAQTLTLSTGVHSFGHFTPSCCCDTTILILRTWIHHISWGGIQSLDPKSISNEI